MKTVKYDAILYGNGLTLNLQTQLQQVIQTPNIYRLFFNDFMKAFIDGEISFREKNELSKTFLKRMLQIKPTESSYDALRHVVGRVVEENGFDYEQILGELLISNTKNSSQSVEVNTVYPFFYNYWHNNLFGWINNQFDEPFFKNYCNSIQQVLSDNRHIFTTNFDRFTDYLKPKHLHGVFSDILQTETDLFFCQFRDNGDSFYKFLWGHNGIGKRNFMTQIQKHAGYGKYYDFSLFDDNQLLFSNMLIYGIGFKKSAYHLNWDTLKDGFIIDDHILRQLQVMQSEKRLEAITFAYFSPDDKKHYENIVRLYTLKNVKYIPTEDFKFSINYHC